MDQERILKQTEKFVKEILEKEGSGHDFWHTLRVVRNAIYLAKKEGGDLFIIELAALLHDAYDHKLYDGDPTVADKKIREWLSHTGAESHIVDQICKIINELSYKGAGVDTTPTTIEGKIVQDADRLDAIGAIGIARTFTYGGHKGKTMHDPRQKPVLHQDFEEYKKSMGTSLNHFYEKLLLLKDRMNTETAKIVAKERHQYMEKFLEEFLKEWDGTDLLRD